MTYYLVAGVAVARVCGTPKLGRRSRLGRPFVVHIAAVEALSHLLLNHAIVLLT